VDNITNRFTIFLEKMRFWTPF